MTAPDVIFAGLISSLVVAIAAIAVALSRVRERLARLEEWIRVNERKERS